jgi:hypothetical protein
MAYAQTFVRLMYINKEHWFKNINYSVNRLMKKTLPFHVKC